MSVIDLDTLVNRDSPSAREFWDGWDREPIVVTRDGKPFAMINPVAEDDWGTIMSALPEFIASRKRAEHARAEERTIPESEVRAHLEAIERLYG